MPLDTSIRFINTLFQNLPLQIETIKPFIKSELADWIITVAYYANSRGLLRLVRRLIYRAICTKPSIVFEPKIVYLLKASILKPLNPLAYRSEMFRKGEEKSTLCLREQIISDYRLSHDSIKVNIGCGDNVLAGWLNADLSPLNRGNVIYIDASQPLPFQDGQVDFIFSEHMIEHISLAAGTLFIRECFRSLKPGGILRIATPSLEFLLNLYLHPDQYSGYISWSLRDCCDGIVDTPAVVLNNFHHNWGHQFIYDYKTLDRLLVNAGFSKVLRCSPGQSQHSELQNLESHHKQITVEFNLLETMIMEATKY